MAIIKVTNLNPAGSELFLDSENFLNDLNESEECGVQGGMWMLIGIAGTLITPSVMFGC